MTLNDEIKLLIADLPNPPEIIDEWEPIADYLSDMFEWAGSKIDWDKTISHSYQKLTNDKRFLAFFSDSFYQQALSILRLRRNSLYK
jgi:hypothetical protein